MRHYPTDLLLAVEHAERHPAEVLTEHGLTGLLNGTALTEALEELFDGLGRYPWRPLLDGDVEEFAPVGTVPLDDEDPQATLRGLLYGLATGN
ncbi:hypothetical protein ACFQ08_05580, partial [Streptosporangium algeriense]